MRTGKIHHLPILVLMPHGGCNCRCIMCDIWKANRLNLTLDEDYIRALLPDIKQLRVKEVVLSGGEPLMHRNLWKLCELIKETGSTITLLSTGLLLSRHAANITRHCDRVIVSLDGDPETHDTIRNIPHAFTNMAHGIQAIKAIDSAFPVTGRCVLQKANHDRLPAIIKAAQSIGLDHISFLAADVTSEAFNHKGGWDENKKKAITLTPDEIDRYEKKLADYLSRRDNAFSSGFVVESPAQMRRLATYFRAINLGKGFPRATCNAPWVSAVIDADGNIRPCFFHPPYGKAEGRDLKAFLNSPKALSFRKTLDVTRDPVCRRCVCRLNYH